MKKLLFISGAILIGGAVLLVGGMRFYSARAGLPREGPVQPIAFSHKLHAGEYQIDCLYCHMYANRSTVAGLPSLKKCRDCHLPQGPPKGEVRKVAEHLKEKKPIRWVKVYDLPDHVYFTHKRHVRVGVSCASCHGEIREMDRVRQVRKLQMGWCVNCHQRTRVRIDALGDAVYEKVGADPSPGRIGSYRYRRPGVDCLICHK